MMRKMTAKVLTVAIAGFVFAGASAVQAGAPDPAAGYTSVHDNILDKGANFGRCNAVGILAGKVCTAEGVLLPPIEGVIPQCQSVGVDLDEEPAIAPCLVPSCEALGTC